MTSPYLTTQSTGFGGYAASASGNPVTAPSTGDSTDSLLAKYFGGGSGQASQYGPGGVYGGYGGYPFGGGYPSSAAWGFPPAPASTSQQPPLTDSTVLARIQSISGKLDAQVAGQNDGQIDFNDLRSALDDKTDKYSKTDKEAIQYMLDNQNGLRGRLDHFDGKDDGKISTATIDTQVANPSAPSSASMSNTQVLTTLLAYARENDMGYLNRERLAAIKDDPNTSEAVKAAADALLKNTELLKAADTGRDNNGDYDGKISREDMESLINRAEVDKIGASSTTSASLPAGGAPYTPMYSGNYYADAYYNNMYASTLGPATSLYQNAPGAPPKY